MTLFPFPQLAFSWRWVSKINMHYRTTVYWLNTWNILLHRQQTNKHTDRQIGGQTDRKTNRLADRQTDRQENRRADRHTGRQAGRQIDRQTDGHWKQTDRRGRTDKQTDRCRRIDRQTERDIHTDSQTTRQCVTFLFWTQWCITDFPSSSCNVRSTSVVFFVSQTVLSSVP